MIKRYLKTQEVIDAIRNSDTIFFGNNCKLIGNTLFMSSDKGLITQSNDAYIIEPLKLEVGKFYRTRSGNKVIVLHVDKNDTSGFPVRVAVVGCTNTLYFVSRTGGHSNGFTSEWDIVEQLGE